MPAYRYIAIAPGRVDGKHVKRLGKAVFLFDFLIDHQTDPEGRVNYGKPISYVWIATRFANCPARRTIERWMSTLKRGHYVRTHRVPFGGLIVTIVAPKKWPAPAQLSLFPPREAVSITCGKPFGDPAGKQSKTPCSLPPEVAASYRQKWRQKDSKEVREEKTRAAARAADHSFPTGKTETEEARDEFFRELRWIAGRGRG